MYENYLANGVWNHNTGKTKVVIDFASVKHQAGKLSMICVICPVSVMGVWEREIQTHTPEETPLRIVRLTGSSKQKVAQLQKLRTLQATVREHELLWVILNYESCWRPGVGKALLDFGFDLVVADEGHRIKSPTAHQAVQVRRLAQKSEYAVLPTGTPITNNPLDLFGQMRFIDPEMFRAEYVDGTSRPMQFKEFKSYYAITAPEDPRVFGYRHLNELYDQVRAVSFIRKKEDCLDLPEKVFQTVPFELGPKSRQAYIDMAEQMVTYLEGTDISGVLAANAAIAKVLYLYRIVCGHVRLDDRDVDIGDEKLKVATDLVDDLVADGQKVVVFARFRRDLDRLEKALGHHGTISIRGGVKEKDRTDGIAAFQDRDTPRVALCQCQSGSLGITLTRASQMVFYSTDYSYGNYYQACDRIHRIGQRNACTYHILMGQDTIEEDIYKVIWDKQELADVLMQRPLQLASSLRASILKWKNPVRKKAKR